MKLIRNLILAITASLWVFTLSASTLVTWDFEGASNSAILKSYTATEGITASDVGTHNLNNVLRNNTNYASTAVTISPATAITTGYSFSNTLNNGAYLSFSLTVAEGYSLSIDSVSLQAASGSSNTSDSSVRAFYVLSSLSGFSNESEKILLQGSNADGLPTRASGALKDFSTPLSSSVYQSIAGGTTVEFRLYIQAAGNTQNLEFDNFILTGSLTAIPEPASATLLLGLIASAGFLFVRRR